MFDDIYSGSTVLSSLSDYTGLRLDQLNFLVCQLFALIMSPVMQNYLHPKKTSPNTRHAFSCIMGLSMVYFCFGSEIWYVLGLSMLCYVIIIKVDPKFSQRAVFSVSMVYLAARHLQRMIYSYGSYTLDITGPLMIMVQKISGLGFSIHDGLAVKEKLPPYREKYIVRKVPSILQFFGYLFQYQCVLAGPNVFYIDYLRFIDGENFKQFYSDNEKEEEPSAFKAVMWKVSTSFLCIGVYFIMIPYFPINNVKSESFLSESLLFKMGYLFVNTTLTRFMYYHAWTLADGICNASGFGFNGYDKNSEPVWDLTSNVDIIGFEFGENMRASINSWNMGTNAWLRFSVYERVNRNNTLLTFLLSAIWHGFYPGYYITFFTGSLFVIVARSVRKYIRPYFLGNKAMKMLYDISTICTTKCAMTYLSFSFILLEFWPSYYVLKSMYFFMHIGAISLLFLLPALARKAHSQVSS